MLNIPVPPMDAFRLGERFHELSEGARFVQVQSEHGAKIGPCVGCGMGTVSAVTTARRCDTGGREIGVGDVAVCAHRLCRACNDRWPGCPHTWDEATMALISLGSKVDE